MNYILFDGPVRNALLPFTFTRPVADIRIGILTVREKWEKHLGNTATTLTEEYLSGKFPMVELAHNIMINASFLPNKVLVEQIRNLSENQLIYQDEEIIAFYTTDQQDEVDLEQYEWIESEFESIQITHICDIFSKNDQAIRDDFALLTEDRISQPVPPGVQAICPEDIFIEEGAKVHFSILNASTGPIYIAKDAEVMEGCLLRGPVALCEHAQFKMGAKIYGATTVGPYSKIGGEVNNAVIFGFSNKGHDGFLGNSVIGEWCNLGADTNNSNLKNNYSAVKLYSYETGQMEDTGLQFCGLMMGDHSKCGINTMFNTGTVVGVSANIYGGGFQQNYIPSFSWGGGEDLVNYHLDKALETMSLVMARRMIDLTEEDMEIFKYIYQNQEEAV